MRDCAEAKSRPAGPACCLRDCKLSLRMQTDMQDRHHLPVLPSTTESAAQCVAPLLPFSSPRRIRASLAQAPTRLYSPLFRSFLLPSRYFPPVTWSLFRQLAAKPHRRSCCHPVCVQCFISSQYEVEKFGLLPLFYQLSSVILYNDLSPHSQDSIRLLKSHWISVNTLRPTAVYTTSQALKHT